MPDVVVLEIDGMSCGHCVASVEKALTKTAGVRAESVEVGRAKVIVDDARAKAAAIAAIEASGFVCRIASENRG